jgi:hypothetical protein
MRDDPRAEADGGGKDKSLVINGVFTHEIDATGGAKNPGFGGIKAAIPLSERQPFK